MPRSSGATQTLSPSFCAATSATVASVNHLCRFRSMPEPTAKRRPPQLELVGPAPADLLVQIVSPIVSLHMSSEMRNTLRLSHSIREEQNSLIAQNSALPSEGEKKSLPLERPDHPVSVKKRETLHELKPLSELGTEAEHKSPTTSPESAPPSAESASTPAFSAPALSAPARGPPAPALDPPAPFAHSSDSSDSDFARTSELASKRIRRAKAPRPLRLVLGAPAPAIKSAPMRSLYGYRRVRPVYPPYSAVHWVPPPGPVRRVVKPPAPARRTVVQDVFHGAVTMAAPMSVQPLLAQRERFDDEPLPQEAEDRHRPDAAVRGTITLNDEAAFNFEIYNDADAKRVFMEVCAKTWDRYMAPET